MVKPKKLYNCAMCGKEIERPPSYKSKSAWCNECWGKGIRKPYVRAEYNLVCAQCGSSFVTGNKRGKFCSPGCAARHYGAQRAKESIKRKTFTCQYCNKVYVNGRSNKGEGEKYCSRECAFRAKEKPIELGIYKEGDYCKVYFPQCLSCGKTFSANRNSQKLCSEKCQVEYSRTSNRERSRTRYLGNQQKYLRESREYNRIKHGYKEQKKECIYCGKLFKTYRTLQKSCSKECSKRLEMIQKKHSLSEVKRRSVVKQLNIKGQSIHISIINAAKIYKRDGWRCQICGKLIDRKKKCPHPLSPSLDHIIPLSRGGDHVEKNLQAAHLRCNSLARDKRNQLIQLRLF